MENKIHHFPTKHTRFLYFLSLKNAHSLFFLNLFLAHRKKIILVLWFLYWDIVVFFDQLDFTAFITFQ